MKKLTILLLIGLSTTATAFAQQTNPVTDAGSPVADLPLSASRAEILLPVLFISFLLVILTSLIKYFLDFRLKNKLIERGMQEQLTAYLSAKNEHEKQNEVVKLSILFLGLGLGLLLTYFTAPVDLHSLAIMAMSLGLSYLAYFLYLRKTDR
ncbi:hypothetical protein IQ13_0940 [Lacibacter cauensis]|uniref:DUF6249 domain-containing protein n=1 Tax=Lacibacter cauensis TaxID=510947 RepID=A0A562SX00_9BACT|nr:DUF6249 domain-containing protein [Lacibacter cauensis]TWI85772.1 hypothetical protein IQ13_0940 [Lacibacter cauensis]